MKDQNYWKQHYVLETSVDDIARKITIRSFPSGAEVHELICFEKGKTAPNILLIPGSGAHAYVFAELGYQMYERGYNVFILPKNGGKTIPVLQSRYRDAAEFIAKTFNGRIGVYAEALGGMAAFYLALAGSPIKSIVCENSPALLNERKFIDAMTEGQAGQRRRALLPILHVLVKVLPGFPTPISAYVKWREVVDPSPRNRDIENGLVDYYEKDPDFDTHYPLRAVMSLVSTPPPKPILDLDVPIRLIVARRGFFPHYFKDLYERLPPIKRSMVEVDGGVYWMLSHPKEAAKVICEWFDETM